MSEHEYEFLMRTPLRTFLGSFVHDAARPPTIEFEFGEQRVMLNYMCFNKAENNWVVTLTEPFVSMEEDTSEGISRRLKDWRKRRGIHVEEDEMAKSEIQPTAVGVYRGDIFPQLKGMRAQLARYDAAGWVVGKFLSSFKNLPTGPVILMPTRREIGYDACSSWILYHEDDFDIVAGELPEMKSDLPAAFVDRYLRDGALVVPAESDPLAELVKIIGEQPAGKGEPVLTPVDKPFPYTRKMTAMMVGCWFVLGIAVGWLIGVQACR